MHGILLVNKPEGVTSHDVVGQIRKIFQTKRVGHAGTLDPFATGLLVVCIGEATRIVEYFTDCDKEYVAEMKLGEATDTQDRTGAILESRLVNVSEDAVRAACARFVGQISQTPPMFSAKRVNGTRLYILARKGETVARPPHPVTIHEIELLHIALPFVTFRVACSKGTYIRALAHDIGGVLGCGAHLTTLERTRIGAFSLNKALTLDQLAQMNSPSDKAQCLIPMSQALSFLPAIELDENQANLILHGAPIVQVSLDDAIIKHAGTHRNLVRVHRRNGAFIALARAAVFDQTQAMQWQFQPIKVLSGMS